MIKGTKVENGASDPQTTDGYCIPGLVGARVDFAIAPSVAICVTPSYSFALVESKLYSHLLQYNRRNIELCQIRPDAQKQNQNAKHQHALPYTESQLYHVPCILKHIVLWTFFLRLFFFHFVIPPFLHLQCRIQSGSLHQQIHSYICSAFIKHLPIRHLTVCTLT